MKKKTALIIFICFVCAAVIGVCVIAGVSKWKQHQQELAQQQQEQQEQQEEDAYTQQLKDAFDKLYTAENGLLDQMAEQKADGVSNRQILANAIDTLREPMNELAAIEAPDKLSGAQAHFSAAAETFDRMAGTLSDLLKDESVSYSTLHTQILALMPDALTAFDELKSGVDALSDSGVDVPNSARLLTDALDSIADSGVSGILGSQ